MTLSVIILFSAVTINLLLGVVVLLRSRSKASVLFFIATLSIILWSITNYLTNHGTNVAIVSVYNHLAYFFAFQVFLFYAWFSLYFIKIRDISIKKICIFIGFSIIGSFISATSLVAGSVEQGSNGIIFKTGSLTLLYGLSLILLLVIIIANLVLIYKRGTATNKSQASLMMFGFSTTGLLAVITNIVLPYLTSNWQSTQIGPALTIFLVGFTTYAMLKHGLFDIRFTVARSLAYLLTIFVAVGLYSMVIFGLGNLFINTHSSDTLRQILYIIMAIIIAITYQPLKKFFDRATNKLFYRDAYDVQNFIDVLNQTIVSDIHLKKLLRGVAEIIQANIKTEFVTFGIKQTENIPQQIIGVPVKNFKQADIDKVRALTPTIGKKIILTDELEQDQAELKEALMGYNIGLLARLATDVDTGREGIGYIVLGYKRSGSPFNSIDVKTMEIIANSMVVAAQNAMQFEEIQHFNITLQQRVKDATRELERSNKKLIELDEAKDEFISMASHQLRTPLTSVKGYVSMLIDGDFGKLNKKQKDVLKDTFASSQRMVFLISDFLNVSRLKTGKFVIEPSEVDLPQVVQEEITQLREMAKSRDLTIEYDAPAGFPKVMLDENKIRQVMMNFVDNAIYYTPAGGKIKIELYATSKDVVYKVIDNGIGVPKKEQHNMFTKFFRAKNAQKARPDGTGLGIFMAQKVIVGQGGSVIFESKENKGSTFGFSFPLKKISPK